MMKTLNAGLRSKLQCVCVAFCRLYISAYYKFFIVIICFTLSVHTFDASNDQQQHAVELVKGWKEKQNSYNRVLVGLKQQKDDFYASKIKQKLVNMQEALDGASRILDDLGVNQTMFDQMVTSKNKDLIRAMSVEVELRNVITLADNSQRILGENSFNMINVSLF